MTEQHNPPHPRISVLIITARRAEQLSACLISLQDQVDPPTFELIVGGVGDSTIGPLVRQHFPEAVVGTINRTHPGAARNPLIERARGDLLLFLDDDVTVEPDLLSALQRLADEHPEVSVFGGPNETPAGSSKFQFIQGAVLASLVASGPVRRRYGRHPEASADERYFTLCNLAVRRQAMQPFAADLVCAEENAVLAAMSSSGLRMLYNPKLVAYHDRRPSLRSFVVQMNKYGRGRGQLLRRNPRTLRLAYVCPPLLLAYLAAAPVIGIVEPISLLPLLAYAGVVAAGATRVSRTMPGARALLSAGLMIVLLHLSYGWGLIQGVTLPDRWSRPTDPVWTDLPRKAADSRA